MINVLVRIIISLVVLFAAVAFFFYPAAIIVRLAMADTLWQTGQPPTLERWFERTARRYNRWAAKYLDAEPAKNLPQTNVAATEWPMFGSVFFLLTAEELVGQESGARRANDPALEEAIDKAAQIVASGTTAAWARAIWGESYLEKENLFYRMLLTMGLATYERITGNTQYRDTVNQQRRGLAEELMAAPFHLLDDYPGQCYPCDVLWAVAAIQRAALLDSSPSGPLVANVLSVLDGPVLAPEGLPAFEVDSRSGRIVQNARGCGNSGILIFAAELDPTTATRWYHSYEDLFWVRNRWIAGFRELPRGDNRHLKDVDSGPVLFGIGSVASAFGIGAARAIGRYDHAVPLTMEGIACSWPTPFGFVIPGVMGWVAADGWCLGEVALLFSISRPTQATKVVVPFSGALPGIVWFLACTYAVAGSLLVVGEIRGWLRWLKTSVKTPNT
jgi:hypothetical protein